MIILILKIASVISLLLFLFIFFNSMMILRRLPRSQFERGVSSWDKLALVGERGSIEPASSLIKQFRRRTLGLLAAIVIIIMGFAIPFFFPENIKNINKYYYLMFGAGLAGGWLIAFCCMYYGSLVSWNLLDTKPPPGVH